MWASQWVAKTKRHDWAIGCCRSWCFYVAIMQCYLRFFIEPADQTTQAEHNSH